MHDSAYKNLARLEDTHWWYTGMAEIAKDWLQQLPGLSSDTPLLDAGCGTGGAQHWLRNFGRPCGVDRHSFALGLAMRKGAQRLVLADVQALPFANGSFKLLTSFDVLYHADVSADWVALQEFARVLRPGGWLLLRLPAYNWLRGAHDRMVQTRHRYTCGEVSLKLRSTGLLPMRVTYANSFLLLPAVVRRMFQRVIRQEAASDLTLPPRVINDLLTGLLRAECAWLRRFNLPVGLSVLALAKKEAP